MNRFSLIVLGFLLSACASSPSPFLASDPIDVSDGQLDTYWVSSDESFSFNLNPKQVPPHGTSGFVKVRFLIDSNGNTFNHQIVESKPEGAWDIGGLKAIKQQKYIAANSNTDKVPVYYTKTISFKFGS